MSWINDVVAGTKILAAWGNSIRDRTVTPFANRTERTNSVPSPATGMASYLADDKAVEYFDGVNWLGDARGIPLAGVIPFFGNANPPGNFCLPGDTTCDS